MQSKLCAHIWCEFIRASMKDTLKIGLTYRHTFTVSEKQTVPRFYPESDLFQAMPQVFATGYMVGLLEWACIELLRPHINWPDEQTLGTHVNFSHEAPTLPGMKPVPLLLVSALVALWSGCSTTTPAPDWRAELRQMSITSSRYDIREFIY